VNPDSPEPPTPSAASLESVAALQGYLAASSDVAAHLVFEHQTHMSNLLTRMGWDARVVLSQDPAAARALTQQLLTNNARELVDYLLFVDEARLEHGVTGSAAFVADFAARGPRDRLGRSLRQLDLQTRLLRYPCSYMVYSPAFDGLPPLAQQAIYRRLWTVLSGRDRSSKYRKLALRDRRAIVAILRDTKPDLPQYFR